MSPEIQNTPLKGTVTIKQVVTFVLAIAAIVALYFNMVSQVSSATRQSKDNNDILKELQSDRKETERINNIRLTNIELDQREAKIRLTNLEQGIKK